MAATVKTHIPEFKNSSNFSHKNMANSEVTQDMHVKMSKKIAQLTKVIYALNTKNDEHEAIVENLKNQYNNEISKVLLDTKEKISKYSMLIGNDLEYKQKISLLEQSNAEYKEFKKQAMEEFNKFKEDCQLREEESQQAHINSIMNMTHHIHSLTDDYKVISEKFTQLQTKFKAYKEEALEEQRLAYQKQIDELYKNQANIHETLSESSRKVHEDYKLKIAKLEETLIQRDIESKRLLEDNETKLSKAQAFYEQELAAARLSTSSADELKSLQQQNGDLKKHYNELKNEHKRYVEELLQKNKSAEEQIKNLRQQMNSTQDEKERRFVELQSELRNITLQMQAMTSQFDDTKMELVASHERVMAQTKDIMKKSEQIGELHATMLQNESLIDNLRSEVTRLKDRNNNLEAQFENLSLELHDSSTSANHQIKALQLISEKANIEKTNVKEKLEAEMKALELSNEKFRAEQLEQHKVALEKLRQEHSNELSIMRERGMNDIKSSQEEFEKRLALERADRAQRETDLLLESERMCSNLRTQIELGKNEIVRLESIIAERNASLDSMNSLVQDFKQSNSQLTSELMNARQDLQNNVKGITNTQAELDRLRQNHETRMKEAKDELRQKLAELGAELDKKWAETLRREVSRTRDEVSSQLLVDKQTALDRLQKLHKEESNRVREEADKRISDLEAEVTLLKRHLLSIEREQSSAFLEAQRRAADELVQAQEALIANKNAHQREMDCLKAEHTQQVQWLQELNDKKLHELEFTYEGRLVDQRLRIESEARASKDAERINAEQKRLIDLKSAASRANQELEEVRQELLARFSAEMEEHAMIHSEQLRDLQKEFEVSKEVSQQRELELVQRAEKLRANVAQLEGRIDGLTTALVESKSFSEKVSNELKTKDQEKLLSIAEAHNAAKKREEEINMNYEAEVMKTRDNQKSELRRICSEFNEAQNGLKEKISDLKVRLTEAEERYRLRESRAEDLEKITNLTEMIAQREAQLKQLADEMKFYKMELVNRETNFNKVFNTSPQVGVMNPLISNKQKKKSFDGNVSPSLKKTASGSSQSRLAPLPGSPLHDELLNPTKPLPPPIKKFMV